MRSGDPRQQPGIVPAMHRTIACIGVNHYAGGNGLWTLQNDETHNDETRTLRPGFPFELAVSG
jgi:hypothetical protein